MSNEKNVYQQFVYVSRYARYLEKEKRREVWEESVKRYFDFFEEFLQEKHNYVLGELRTELENSVLNYQVMPSMRGLMTAGEALKRDNAAIYNCAYLPIDSYRALDEELYTLMLGTGVGFSVESDYVNTLPVLPDEFHNTTTIIVFEDSRLGWAKGYREFISLLSAGQIPKWDVSKLRPKGAKLKTFGGRSSGPDPLVELLEFTQNIFKRAVGRKLSTLECHDLSCKVSEVVVSGGVRRSALISLSDLNDEKLRDCKSGNWWATNGQRRLSNNSAIYNEKPDVGVFMREWLALYESKSGERGIISRKAMKKVIEHANTLRLQYSPSNRIRDPNYDFGTNPCGEILLRSYEFCNLTSVQIYQHDTEETLKNKIRLATILGTFQSCLTNFKYINKKWQRNCEDERLLGVSLNGIFDNKITNGKNGRKNLEKFLLELREIAINSNRELSEKLNINQSVAITCVKPEGCVTLDTKIKTSKGVKTMLEISQLLSPKNVLDSDVKSWINVAEELKVYDENNKEQRITKLFVNGISPVYEIIMDDGVMIKITKDHQLKTTDGWKKAEFLKDGDEILSW